LHSAVYTISHGVFFGGGGGWGGGGDKTFPKFDKSFAESFAKILAKFDELKISKKTQYYAQYYYSSSFHNKSKYLVCDFAISHVVAILLLSISSFNTFGF